MNERLLELADQVMENLPGPWNIPDEFCKKFAGLIVRECADVMINDPRLRDVRSAARGCARSIKEHFGVEE